MSQSPSAKRKHAADETDPPPKRKIRSCDRCRRLKTRYALPENSDQYSPSKDRVPQHVTQTSGDIDQRLHDLENSLAQVKATLDQVLGLHRASNEAIPTAKVGKEQDSVNYARRSPQVQGPLVADRNSRTAPASLIRDMKHYILGEGRGSHETDASEDIVAKGIISEEVAHSLFIGFSKLSRRWLFMRSDPSLLQQAPSLLRASCILAGLQIDSNLHGSQLHHDLYQHVSGLLSKTMLGSPLSLEAIQSMLIFSMWNLVPNSDTEHLDPWLLSGVAAMQGMLAINFEQLLKPRTDGLVDRSRSFTLIVYKLQCFCVLSFWAEWLTGTRRFSVGTGRPPVLSRQYLKQCKNILSLPSYNSRDQLVASGVELYDLVCNLVNLDTVQTDSLVWAELDDWKKRCGQFFELDSTKPLRFAYSCSYLILTRRTLKYLAEQPSKHQKDSIDTELDPSLYIHLAIEHAHRILHLFLAMSDLTDFVRPAYENLLCSFAMVTLSEFAIYLDDIDQTLSLMERTSQHVQLGGKAEPVSKWALSIMRKHVSDDSSALHFEIGQSSTFTPKQGLDVLTATNTLLPLEFDSGDWGAPAFQEFPSLEEMFLGN
ncbi:Zn(2)-C6 zinc finger-containing prtT [Hyphodiscus hymeniophilus]|uniref:Zn(2)-C6 zinc finger-containing prtT n=1 Tax=Hyphodiscus hymeniophilus TaxID=353542 RepID=A0A9P6VJF9_9HELO|nr:Zn(2)-C6 zinc finger-containing prtT [Hyphodiscus hymeniophilus]